MKILCVSQRFSPAMGGAELLAEKLMDFLSTIHEITVYTTDAIDLNDFWIPNSKKDTSYDIHKNYVIQKFEIVTPSEIDVKLYDFPFSIGIPGPFSPGMWQALLTLGKNYDLIIASGYPYNHIIPAYLASRKFGIPLISIPHLHLEFPEIYFTGLRLAILHDSDIIVVNTNREKKELLKYNIPEKKIKVISPSVDTAVWSNPKVNDLHLELKFSQNSLIVLFAGYKSAEKGIINLIESLKKLWHRNLKIELVTIGESAPDFVQYVNKQDGNVKKHIHDLGLVSEEQKRSIFSSCDIVALPSISESFGLVFLEAWICGKPVIGCNIDVTRELIDDQIDGFLVDFGNNEQLSHVLEKLMEDSKLRKFLGDNGKKKVLLKYNSKNNLLEFEKICESLHK